MDSGRRAEEDPPPEREESRVRRGDAAADAHAAYTRPRVRELADGTSSSSSTIDRDIPEHDRRPAVR